MSNPHIRRWTLNNYAKGRRCVNQVTGKVFVTDHLRIPEGIDPAHALLSIAHSMDDGRVCAGFHPIPGIQTGSAEPLSCLLDSTEKLLGLDFTARNYRDELSEKIACRLKQLQQFTWSSVWVSRTALVCYDELPTVFKEPRYLWLPEGCVELGSIKFGGAEFHLVWHPLEVLENYVKSACLVGAEEDTSTE